MNAQRFERFEYKYCIPEERVEEVRRFIAPYVVTDSHAAGRPGNRYTIYNVYLDTPALDLYWACEQDDVDRYKLRLRWYDAEGRGPVFFEVKRKVRQVIVKDRMAVSRDQLRSILRGEPHGFPEGAPDNPLDSFLDRMWSGGAVPQLLTRYNREPYESAFGDYARITFDRAMCHQRARGFDLRGDENSWTYVDSGALLGGEGPSTLIELKFGRLFPAWMSDLVRTFDLERVGFSKYAASVLYCVQYQSGAALDRGRRSILRA